jgi:nitrite reductase (NO-forming)
MPKAIRTMRALMAVTFAATLASAARAGDFKPLTEEQIAKLPHVQQKLVAPPAFPEHEQVATGGFKVVEIRFDVEEKQITLDDEGTKTWVFAYNGTVPGPMVVAHEGDYVELTLHNKAKNVLQHNIDFHAATGALGGGGLTLVNPGETVKLRFRATKVGTFVYHCAPGGVMIPWHVTKAMNGAITILPRNGLKDGNGKSIRYDRAYYIGEQDFYIKKGEGGKYKRYPDATSSMGDDLEVMKTNNPSHVVFNGKAAFLTGANAMKAKVGETVLFVHSQSNRDTRPHLIGGHGDYVWERGSFNDKPQTDLETWFIAGGSAGAAIYKFRQSGVYAYLNHNLIDAVLKGAIAHVVVEGAWDDDLMKQTQKPTSADGKTTDGAAHE